MTRSDVSTAIATLNFKNGAKTDGKIDVHLHSGGTYVIALEGLQVQDSTLTGMADVNNSEPELTVLSLSHITVMRAHKKRVLE